MATLVLQLLGFAILMAGIAAGWRRWSGKAGAGTLTAIVTMVGGLAGAPFWWMDYPASFSWDLPPLASRMLAAAALSFGVAGLMVLERPSEARLRLYLTMLAVYLTPLALAIAMLHLDRFDWRAPITYAFFVVVAGLIVAAVVSLLRIGLHEVPTLLPPPAGPRALFLIVAVVTGLWGIALYVSSTGPFPLLWIWPSDALTSRLIGTMLVTVAVMALMARRDRNLAQVSLTVLAVYGFGAAAAGLMNLAAGKPVPVAYVTVLGCMGLFAAPMLLRHLRT